MKLNENRSYTVILSLDSKEAKQPESLYYTESIAAYLNKAIASTLVMGGYTHQDGTQVEERGLYAVNCTPSMVSYLQQVAARYGQESVLLVDQATKDASLLFEDGRIEGIGCFTEVSEDEAHRQPGWTRIANKFYTCMK